MQNVLNMKNIHLHKNPHSIITIINPIKTNRASHFFQKLIFSLETLEI